eukprot:scaffold71109_cov63-Phaeocystis_antarctica.AAC.2
MTDSFITPHRTFNIVAHSRSGNIHRQRQRERRSILLNSLSIRGIKQHTIQLLTREHPLLTHCASALEIRSSSSKYRSSFSSAALRAHCAASAMAICCVTLFFAVFDFASSKAASASAHATSSASTSASIISYSALSFLLTFTFFSFFNAALFAASAAADAAMPLASSRCDGACGAAGGAGFGFGGGGGGGVPALSRLAAFASAIAASTATLAVAAASLAASAASLTASGSRLGFCGLVGAGAAVDGSGSVEEESELLSSAATTFTTPRSSSEKSVSRRVRSATLILPSATYPTCVASIASQKALSCETTTTAPSYLPMASSSAATASTSRWLVGSSRRMTLHGVRQKVASATRAFSPPESEPIRRVAFSPIRPSDPMIVRQLSSVIEESADRTVSATYSHAAMSCGRSCARSCAKKPSSRRSSSRRCPAPTGIFPARALRMVLLPAPFGPRRMSRMPFSTSSCAPLMMSTEPSGWRMLASRNVSGAMPHAGGRASVSAGLRCSPMSNAFMASCSTASLRNFPSRSFACVAFEAFAPMRSMKPCIRFRSRSCASTVATTRACRSSRSVRNLSNEHDLYSCSRPPATSAMDSAALRTNSASCETTSTVPSYSPT